MQKTIVGLVICCWSLWVTQAVAQPTLLYFHPVFMQQPMALNTTVHNAQGDSLSVTMLRFYVGHFKFLNKSRTVLEDNTYHLLDLEEENTLKIPFQLPQNTVFDTLQFDLGVDSLTNVSGAIGGDLDPTKGMYWAWQSGYVNFKIEGIYEKCPTRDRTYSFHLGGYLPPFQSVQTIKLAVPKTGNLDINIALDTFFAQIDWQKKYSIMSPSKAAVGLMQQLTGLFYIKYRDKSR
jgi:hypothetical protein